MNKSTISPEELIEELEQTPPVIYAKVSIPVKNKKGEVKMKACNLNLVTGDIYPNRKLTPEEMSNFTLVRQYRFYNDPNSAESIVHYAHQKAEITDAGITMTTWVYGDYVNYPNTAKFEAQWYGALEVFPEEDAEPIDEKALAHIELSPPHIAAMAVITRDKELFLWENVEKYGFKTSRNRNEASRYLGDGLIRAISHAADARRVIHLTECFKEYFDIGYVGANKYVTFDSYKDISRFMKSSEMKLKKSPKQDVVDALVAHNLPDHSIVAASEQVICYADRVNEEWTVLRWWTRVSAARYVETSRMYVNKNEAVMCRNNLKGDWVYSAAKIKAESFNADKVVMQSDTVLDGTKLEYFKKISAELSNQSAALYMLTTYPEFEKMYKIGMGWLCNNYLKSIYQMSWKNYVEHYCGHVDWKAKNIHKMLGINNYQVTAIREYMKKVEEMKLAHWETWYVKSTVRTLKNIFVSDEINSVDNETFDYILNSMCHRDRLSGSYSAALAQTFELYGKDAMYFIKDLNAISNGTQRFAVRNTYGHISHMTIDAMYSDTLRMIHSGNYMSVLRPRFSSVEELASHHEIMVDLINAEAEAQARRTDAEHAEGFKKFQKRWKQLEWDGNNEFCIIAPERPLDVAAEGITLRHCVKSFIPSLSTGSTNVVFIRRKGYEDTPFFTVEVDNTKNIRQIHGMNNCNVDTVDGLEEFVVAWAKKKKLSYVSSFAKRLRAAEH